jgi:hypothetical protein
MELGLNLLWLLLAAAGFALLWRGRGNRALTCRQSFRRIVSLACALVIVFPIISLTDDLHAAQAVIEDSKPAKGISKSSGAHGAASNLNKSSLPFTVVAAGLLPGQSPRLLGLTAIQETGLLVAASAEAPNPRAPPSRVCQA